MEMNVIEITETGRIADSDFTVAACKLIRDRRAAAFLPADANERVLSPSCYGRSVLLVNDVVLEELRQRDPKIEPVGCCNSADITKRKIIIPEVE